MLKYTHLSLDEREKIYILQKDNKSLRSIAKHIGRSASTIQREIKKNLSLIGYTPDRAHAKIIEKRKRRKSKLDKNLQLKQYIIDRLVYDKWPPEAIEARLKNHENIGNISYETIYQFIYSREGNKMKLYDHLMYKRKARQLRHIRVKRAVVSEEHRIANRPEEINNRLEPGHFEGDLTFFKGSNSENVISMLERVSRKTFLTRNCDKTTIGTISKISKRIKPLPKAVCKSMTFDNGGEFRQFAPLGLIGLKVYFCDPHSPWQKGSVERMHVHLHKYIPKKTDIRAITEQRLKEAEEKLNNLPRKVLNYLTPNEVWNNFNNQSVALLS